MPPSEPTRKVRPKPQPYNRKPKAPVAKADHATTAKPIAERKWQNLTLGDWMTVFNYIDKHPDVAQADIVEHFKTRREGVLTFDQSTLSRKIRDRAKLEECVNSTPNALSSKRPCTVTRPDVERALIVWVRHMETKGETVTGPMLREKRKRYEEMLEVPKEECLTGEGWVAPFCKAYKIKEIRRHGEAASVDLAAVEAERVRMTAILSKYSPQDQLNFDETSLFAFTPPDRGLATKQMSGKKKDKFRITVGFLCSAVGEKFPPFFIGKSKQPRCFSKKKPETLGFYYRNNKKAWMTLYLFEEYIKKLDLQFRLQNRRVVLSLDNFSGHFITYEPRNIELAFFEPNLTSFVQPLDAGIIRCFKAHYRRSFCLRAIDLDEAGEVEIYRLTLLEGMQMARDAWNAVDKTTIINCWRHTRIQDSQGATASIEAQGPTSDSPSTHADVAGILRQFATSSTMSLPQAERLLQERLGEKYCDEDYREVFKAVMDAEDDTDAALVAVEKFVTTDAKLTITIPPHTKLTIKIPPRYPPDSDRENAEKELMKAVQTLKQRYRISGEPPKVEELVNPKEEDIIKEIDEEFDGPAGDKAIIATAQHQLAEERGDVVVVESDDSDEEEEPVLPKADLLHLCEQLEKSCIHPALASERSSFLAQELRKFWGHLRSEIRAGLKQSTLEGFLDAAMDKNDGA